MIEIYEWRDETRASTCRIVERHDYGRIELQAVIADDASPDEWEDDDGWSRA